MLLAALAATLKPTTPARRRGAAASNAAAAVLKTATAAPDGRRRGGGARRSQSYTGEGPQSRSEGLVQGGPLPLVKVQRASWPGAADTAAVLSDENAGPDGGAGAAADNTRTDFGGENVDGLILLGADADAPWPSPPGC